MIKRLFLLAVVATLLARPSFAQKEKDSYKKSLSSRTSAEQLLREAEALMGANPDSALDKVQQALAISVAQGDGLNQARGYILLAKVNEGILEWKLAYENYLRAKEKLAFEINSREYIQTLKGLGNMALKLRDYTAALQYYQEALNLPLTTEERMALTIAVSEVHYQMQSYKAALSVLDTAYGLNNVQNPQFQNQCQKIDVRLNGLDTNQNLFNNPLNAIRRGNRISSEVQQSFQETKDEIADVLQKNKLYDQEIHLRKQSIEFNTSLNNLAEAAKTA